jgi:glucan biosynthesis protein C
VSSQTMPVTSVGAIATRVRARPAAAVRFAYIDNLRIFLVALVIVHHLAVTYGGEGSWYYTEGRADSITAMVLTLFVVINQAFFMGLYFLIAAYFVPRSLERKGSKRFLQDRLLRLGVPLAFQLLVIGPLLAYALSVNVWGFEGSLWTYLGDYRRGYPGLDSGPLWFIEALLIFTVLYVLWHKLAKPPAHPVRKEGPAPGNRAIALYALLVGLITFIVRIWLPVGWNFAPLNFQFPHFPQYISLFVIGTLAYRRGWLSAIAEDAARARLWGRVVAFLIAIAPILFVVGGALDGDTTAFRGGLHWQALVYAVFEQLLCVAIIISLLVWFRRRYDHQGTLAQTLSASAYAVYIFHGPILVFVSLALRSLEWHALLKLALASLISLPLCFAAGGLLRRLPAAGRVL